MSEIILAKQSDLDLTDTQRAVLRECLFGMVDGMSDADKKSWRRFWNGIWRLGSGEFFSIKTLTPRFGPAHRAHMKMESVVFQSQERFQDFEQFRLWVKVGSGFVTWCTGPKGGVFPVPKSISYAKCEEGEFRQFHEDSIAFLRTEHAQKYLWPAISPAVAEQSMEAILAGFDQ